MGNSMLLTVCALVLFGWFLVGSNRLMLENNQIGDEAQYTFTAISLAQSVIEEAKSKAFDEKTVGTSVSTPSQLTSPSGLGADGTETFQLPDQKQNKSFLSETKHDDIDDYNGYSRIVNTPRLGGYNVQASVSYASETYPDSLKTTQTFCKVMSVTVTSQFISRPITLSQAFYY